MPRVSFKNNVVAGDEKFPRFKLTANARRGRIYIPGDPYMEFYHRIEAPLISDGEPQMEVRDGKNGKYEAWKMQWIGSPWCLGDTGTPEEPGPLLLKGTDPDNCPGCNSAAKGTGLEKPQQRFATEVVSYQIKGRGNRPYDLADPVSGQVLIWAYTARVHGIIYELGQEYDGDLTQCDFKIELEDTPGAEKYQKIKQYSTTDAAVEDAAVRAFFGKLWNNQENRPTEEQLRDACLGREVARPVFMDMVRRAERQFSQATAAGGGGGDTAAADSGFNGSLDEGIDSLLDDHPGGAAEFASPEQRQQLADAKREARESVNLSGQKPGNPTATGATTTGTSAPAAGSRSRTAPKSAKPAASSEGHEQAVGNAADEMFGEDTGNGTAEPAQPRAPKQRQAAEPEPAAVPAGAGAINFDDLFPED